MDSQESQAGGHHQNHQPPHHPHLHSFPHHPHPHHLQQHTPPHTHPMMMPQQQQQNNSYIVPNNNILTHNNNYNNLQQFQQQNLDYSDGGGGRGSSSPRGLGSTSGFSIDPPGKKKRGRPRKYSPDGNIALGLSPTTPVSSSVIATPPNNTDSSTGGGGGDGGEGTSSEHPSKKARGRPPGSGKKQLDALGAAGIGFTPHVIMVNVGEDIASKIMSFSQQGPRTVCILSANGAVCNVTLRQPAMGGGTVSYEGRFEIISLSGSFLRSESNDSSRASGLSVSLAGADGRVMGGGVAGTLMAATTVQVIVGSFIAEGKKPKSKVPPSTPPSNMLNFGAPVTGASPPSQGASSDSSDENGDSPFHHEPGPYGNAAGQPMHGMSMYSNMGWPKSL